MRNEERGLPCSTVRVAGVENATSPLRGLPLMDLRREILTCHRCFEAPSQCSHHEDVLGGYDGGRITVVGVNPQASEGDVVYEAIRNAPWKTKTALSD